MTEVEWAVKHLEAVEQKVVEARKALREARITEAAGSRKPVDVGFWGLLRAHANEHAENEPEKICDSCFRDIVTCSLAPCIAVQREREV